MRVLQILIAIVFVLLGVGFSALNVDPVTLDLYFQSYSVPLGVVVLVAMLLGALLGGVALTAGVVWPLRRRLRRADRQARPPEASTAVAVPVTDAPHRRP